jgi:hypothetical protein
MPVPVRAVVICVNYDDLLAVTMPALLPHVTELVVVTAPQDAKTQALVAGQRNARTHVTDAFYRRGAKFNKGLAMEEGFDALGREGWILVLDADILVPPDLGRQVELLRPRLGCLYTPRRRILDDPRQWEKYADHRRWSSLPGRREDKGHYGYFQLFHAADPVLKEQPWYATEFTHAGQCDDKFQHRWPVPRKLRPTFEVLHLGRCDENWFGRTTARVDGAEVEGPVEERKQLQLKLRQKHGWGVKRQAVDLDERVNRDG